MSHPKKRLNVNIAAKPVTLKYRLVAKALRKEIEAGVWQPGVRIPAERDLMQRFEVAHMTIRQAVSSLVEEGALQSVQGKGTFVMDSGLTRTGKPVRHPMAFLIPSELRYSDAYYFPEILTGFRQVMDEHGYSPTLYSTNMPIPSRVIAADTAVACLLLGEDDIQPLENLKDSGYSVVAINHYRGRRSIPTVRIDDSDGVRQAIDHLIALGHQSIGFIAGPQDNCDALDRKRGYRAAVKLYGFQSLEAGDDFSEETGYRTAHQILQKQNGPTALVCASDLSAIGVMKAAHDLGLRIPDDLSLIGFGDFSLADYVNPPLTTVRQDRKALGRYAARSLIHIANDENPRNVVLPPELIVRGSTASP